MLGIHLIRAFRNNWLSANTRRARQRFAAVSSEALEERLPLTVSVGPGVLHDGGQLYLTGTNANDAVNIAQKNGSLVVKAFGENYAFAATEVSEVIIRTNGGNDKIAVNAASPDVEIFAGEGDDKIKVTGGTVSINGEGGYDAIKARQISYGSTYISGGANDDKIAFVSTLASPAEIRGGNGNDVIKSKTLYGSSIDAGAGNDKVAGGIGDDTIHGGDGDDTILGVAGRDALFGENGNDVIVTKKGNAGLVGGNGNDILVSKKGSSLIIGGSGADQLRGSKFGDVLVDGSTAFDNDADVLHQILDDWMSGGSYLNRGEAVLYGLNDATVTHDGSHDLLYGLKSHDLFFATEYDTTDADSAEAVIDISSLHEDKHLFIISGQSNAERHIPEEAFLPAVEAAYGADNVIVVQDALGGQPIRRWYRDWVSESGQAPNATGDLYDRLVSRINAAILGQNLDSVTFIWMQGERDAKDRQGDVYASSLRGLHTQLSVDLGRSDVNFVIGRLSDHDLANRKYADWTQIRSAQIDVANSNARFTWINTDDLNDGITRQGKYVKNDLHYTADGYRILGERFAAAAISLIRG